MFPVGERWQLVRWSLRWGAPEMREPVRCRGMPLITVYERMQGLGRQEGGDEPSVLSTQMYPCDQADWDCMTNRNGRAQRTGCFVSCSVAGVNRAPPHLRPESIPATKYIHGAEWR
ncbi:hypothetical protein LX36DRAFT_657116 [Colletotrichum falcatum]|nr:hypothetical protein LX36DRAFT_657116 [Colletotrichum falcatum]